MEKYKWVAYSHDESYIKESGELFDSEEKCYEDMRKAALKKMTWNTEYDEDFDNEESSIEYRVYFSKWMIAHKSYSGVYVYIIFKDYEKPLYENVFSDEIIKELKAHNIIDAGDELCIERNRGVVMYGKLWKRVSADTVSSAITRNHSVNNIDVYAEFAEIMQLEEGVLFIDNINGQMLIESDEGCYYTNL